MLGFAKTGIALCWATWKGGLVELWIASSWGWLPHHDFASPGHIASTTTNQEKNKNAKGTAGMRRSK
jgi:hypothetical protein